MTFNLRDFVKESNRIEGILRPPSKGEINAHEKFLALKQITVADMESFVKKVAGRFNQLRDKNGLNVRVGRYRPPSGSVEVRERLESLLKEANWHVKNPYLIHQEYEHLHPFTDGNGRSGRVLWLWMMGGIEEAPLGFLHHWYYQSLSGWRD